MREDKKRVPFGCIPNGSGDDFCASLTILNVDRALDFIVKGDIIKLDIQKVLIDSERVEDVPQDQKLQKFRYMLINSSFNIAAKVNYGARKYKWCCCNPYKIAAIGEICKF